MQSDKEISLSIDFRNVYFMEGNPKIINKDNKYDYKYDYITSIVLALPIDQNEFKEGSFQVSFEGSLVNIYIFKVEEKSKDPLLQFPSDLEIELSGSGIPKLPLKLFTDTKGQYPYYCAELIFPFLLADWYDPLSPNGIKMDYDYKRVNVTGPPDVEDKIDAIVVLNELFSSVEYGQNRKSLAYEDITFFGETYIFKQSSKVILRMINALTSRDVFRDVVIEHFLGRDGKEILSIAQERSVPIIQSESELLNFIMEFIRDFLIHHIENRRWIEPFWDGSRKIKINGEETLIPAEPKDEPEIQPTLHVFFHELLNPLGIHVTRETDEGIGYLDFKFLYTTTDRRAISVCSEFKLAHHKKIEHGITKQLPAYLKANKSKSGIFAVMWFKDENSKFYKEPKNRIKSELTEFLKMKSQHILENEELKIETLVIDASFKPSASNI